MGEAAGAASVNDGNMPNSSQPNARIARSNTAHLAMQVCFAINSCRLHLIFESNMSTFLLALVQLFETRTLTGMPLADAKGMRKTDVIRLMRLRMMLHYM
jgi:hypothetical protein